MAKFPTYEEMGKKVAEKALDEFLYNGKSIREWMLLITSEDAISRQAVLKLVNSDWKYEGLESDIENLPPVTPQQKSGKWITKIKSDLRGDMWPTNPKCSECGGEPYYSNTIYSYKFCPYCGAKMEGETE